MSILGQLRRLERTAWTIESLAARVPHAVEFLTSADRAYQQQGWKGAAGYVAAGGWRPGLTAVHPALAEAAEYGGPKVLEGVGDIYGYLTGRELGGEPEPETLVEPWKGPLAGLNSIDYGVIVIFGEKDFGKSTLALRLAYGARKRLNWPVDIVGVWKDDKPRWAHSISMRRVIARMQKVARYLDQEDDDEIDDGLTDAELAPKGKNVVPAEPIEDWEIDAMSRRIVVIDEGHLFFSGLGGDGSGARDAAKGLQNQVRHLKQILIVICQKQSEMPRNLKTAAIQLFKPAGEQFVKSDYREGEKMETTRIWAEVLSGLAAVKTGRIIQPPKKVWEDPVAREGIERCALANRWFKPPYDTVKAWSYLIASNLGGRDYHGPIPNTALTKEQYEERDDMYSLAAGA